MKNIAIIDADLIGGGNHRFPNLVCEKIGAFYKEQGANVYLKTDWENLGQDDETYVSKVFTFTPTPAWLHETDNIHLGGTGFFFDKAPNLPDEIEHHMPDYHLYDNWIEDYISKEKNRAELNGKKFNETSVRKSLDEYTDYSIGFMTRGCFRKCGFCVNHKYSYVFPHSPLEEFYDPSRKKICLLDDNFLGCPQWKPMLQSLIDTNKPFKFKQGLDERILTDEKCEMLFNAKYDGMLTFAFDNIEDYDLIEKKLQMIRRYTDKKCIFYVLVGFDRRGLYDENFYIQDIIGMFKRMELLGRYGCQPYIMRFEKYADSRWRSVYITVARWCNQFSFFNKESLYEYITITDWNSGGRASTKMLEEFSAAYPDIVRDWFHKKYFIKGVKLNVTKI